MVFTEPMHLTGLTNMTQEPSASGGPTLHCLQKTSGKDGCNATAYSVECIDNAHSCWKGLRFKVPLPARQSIDIGFMREEPSSSALRESCSYRLLSFDVHCGTDSFRGSWLHALENGKIARDDVVPRGSLKAGDVIDFRLADGDSPKMQIWVNDVLKHTWHHTPVQFPLIAKVHAARQGPVVKDLCWITKMPRKQRPQQLEGTLREVRVETYEVRVEKEWLAAGKKEKEREKEQLRAELGQAKEAARMAAQDKQELEASLKKEQAEGRALADEKAKLESQLREERRASAQALADEKAKLKQKKTEASQAQLVKLEKKTANIWNLLAFILALISALALNHLVGIVRSNSD